MDITANLELFSDNHRSQLFCIRDFCSNARLATKVMAELTERSMMTSLEERNAAVGQKHQGKTNENYCP